MGFLVFGVVAGAVTILWFLIYERRRHLERKRLHPSPRVVRARLCNQAKKQIERAKRNGKYIPAVFAEAHLVKNYARLFCHPHLLLRKTLANAESIDTTFYNRLLLRIGKASFSLGIPGTWRFSKDIRDVPSEVGQIDSYLKTALAKLYDRAPLGTWEAFESTVDESHQYMFSFLKYNLRDAGFALGRAISDVRADLGKASARILLITSKAGSGKTNLVCDLVDRFLVRWRLPCLMISGEDFRRESFGGLQHRLPQLAMGESYPGDLKNFLSSVQKLCISSNVPFTIILDGINEHRDLTAFAGELESLIEHLLEWPFIRVIITCRSEYFKERFRNLLVSSFSNQIQQLKDIHSSVPQTHRQEMLSAYFDCYNIDAGFLSKHVTGALTSDPLLLRFFCEAYGDMSASTPIRLPDMTDIYREGVFRRYLQRKLDQIALRRPASSRPGSFAVHPHKRVLGELVRIMVERQMYSDIPVSDLDPTLLEPLDDLLAEDILVRKDLVGGSNFIAAQEVLNFTFDEFRDYLLAGTLVDLVPHDGEGQAEFSDLIRAITHSGSPVAEGVSRYLFYRAKRERDMSLRQTIRGMPWYEDVFRECIFSTEEDLITEEDVAELTSYFTSGRKEVPDLVISLARNWRAPSTSPLHTTLLFQLLDTLSDEKYEELIRPMFEAAPSRSTFSSEESSEIDRLVEDLSNAVKRSGEGGYVEYAPLFEFLSYLLPIEGRGYSRPAEDLFIRFSYHSPDLARTMLVSRTGSSVSCVVDAARRVLHRMEAFWPADVGTGASALLTQVSQASTGEPSINETHNRAKANRRAFIRIGEHGHLVRLRKRIREDDFVRASGASWGSFAAGLARRMYCCLLAGATDLRKEYKSFYSKEYRSVQEYLFWQYLIDRGLIESACVSLGRKEKLFWRKASAGGDYQLAQYLEDDEGANLADRIIQAAEGEAV